MLKKLKLQFVIIFLAGFITAGLVAWSLTNTKIAHADQYSCIRKGLNAMGMSGNIPDPTFRIAYDIPSCYSAAGYKAVSVSLYGSNQIMVKYQK